MEPTESRKQGIFEKWFGMGEREARLAKIAFFAASFVFAIVLAQAFFFSVNEYERAVLTRFNKIAYVAEPGLNVKVPFIDSVSRIRTDILSLSTPKGSPGLSVYTVDNQEIHVIPTIQYKVRPEKVAFIYAQVQNLEARLFQVAEDRLKSELGKINTSHVAEQRGRIRDEIKSVLSKATENLGVEIVDFQLSNIDYDPTFKDAVKKAASARATVETREQERQQEIKVAEKVRIVAEGAANAAREKAKGEADALLAVAQAEAKSIALKGEATAGAMKAQALALSANPVLVEMKKAEQWDGKLPVNMYAGAPVPLLNLGSSK